MIFLKPLPGGAWISSTELPGLNVSGKDGCIDRDRLRTTAVGNGQSADLCIRFYYSTVENVDVIRL